MALEQKGIVTFVGEKTLYGNQGNYNCILVIKTTEQYSKDICFEAHNDKCDKVQELRIGQEINIHFNLQSTFVNGRYFTKASLWKFEVVGQNT